MTQGNYWYESLREPLEAEAIAHARTIVDAFHGRDVPVEIGGVPDDPSEDDDLHPGGIGFMYATDHILVREEHLAGTNWVPEPAERMRVGRQAKIMEVLNADDRVREIRTRRVVGNILHLHVNPRTDLDAAGPERPDALELVRAIEDELGPGIAAPDHVLTAGQIMHPCAATEPQEVCPGARPYPAVCWDGGAGVRIFQGDTGLVEGAAKTFPWLAGVTGEDDPRAASTADGEIKPYGGHGTFTAGVLRAMAPQARVRVENIFGTAGSALESEIAGKLHKAFRFGPEIVHITASCHTHNNIPPLALEAWLKRLRAYKGVVCVAEAGNNFSRRPAWPAAFPDVISVGALAADWRHRADFSNYGGWVDVYAPGENLINAFGRGTYKCEIPPNEGQERTFSGLAEWSGTSFAAPIVSGLIAARMARQGESARDAATALLAQARAQAIPGVGPVLLPGSDDGERGDGAGGHRHHGHAHGG